MALWLLAAVFFNALFNSLSLVVVFSESCLALWSPWLGKRELIGLFFFGLWLVYCLSWFVGLTLGVIGGR